MNDKLPVPTAADRVAASAKKLQLARMKAAKDQALYSRAITQEALAVAEREHAEAIIEACKEVAAREGEDGPDQQELDTGYVAELLRSSRLRMNKVYRFKKRL